MRNVIVSVFTVYLVSLDAKCIPKEYQLDLIPDLTLTCNLEHSYNYQIYCSGPILEAVMALKIFSDSKTFVDKPLRYPPNIVLDKFKSQFNNSSCIEKSKLKRFLIDNFDDEGRDLKR